MKFKNEFKDIYNEYVKSLIINSLSKSLLISSSALLVSSLCFWLFGIKEYYLNIIGFILIEVILFIAFYLKNRPSDKKLASKLDENGLEQRVITMMDYKNDNSLLARIQREDAINHIRRFDKKLIRLTTSITMIVLMIALFISGSTVTVFAALENDGIINTPIGNIREEITSKSYEVYYEVDGEGYIDGDMFQLVKAGEDASGVLAVAEDEWVFIKWSDGYDKPYRQDLCIDSDLEVYAIFVELDEEDQESDGDEGEPSDEENLGEPNNDKSQQSEEGDPGEGEGGGAGGKYDSNNQVIDGETYYGDGVFDNAYDDAIDRMSGNNEMNSDLKEIVGDYYKVIQK